MLIKMNNQCQQKLECKSQRYQAAVDGHYAALNHWSILRRFRALWRPEPEYGLILSIREALGGAVGFLALYKNPPFQGDFFC